MTRLHIAHRGLFGDAATASRGIVNAKVMIVDRTC
jgi:hypothetical protein